MRFTVEQTAGGYQLAVHVREARSEQEKDLKSLELKDYRGRIQLRIDSGKSSYALAYSLDEGKTWVEVASVPGDKFISQGYTGAYLGLFALSQGNQFADFADFDWVKYAPRPRL